MEKIQLFNDHFQNFKVYGIPHAQLIIADPPYNLGKNAYASNPAWYKDGDNKNGESELAGKEFFDTDKDFRPAEFMHFCSQMLVKEPKQGITDADIDEYGVQKEETIGGGQKGQIAGPVHGAFLCVRAIALLYRIGCALRPKKLYSACFPQEFFCTGVKSKHEDCGKLRIWFGFV